MQGEIAGQDKLQSPLKTSRLYTSLILPHQCKTSPGASLFIREEGSGTLCNTDLFYAYMYLKISSLMQGLAPILVQNSPSFNMQSPLGISCIRFILLESVESWIKLLLLAYLLKNLDHPKEKDVLAVFCTVIWSQTCRSVVAGVTFTFTLLPLGQRTFNVVAIAFFAPVQCSQNYKRQLTMISF